MGWGNYKDNNSKKDLGFFEEGNVKLFQFSETPKKIRFLVKEISVEDIMFQQKISREEAEEYKNTKLQFEEWIQPVSFWIHTIKAIPEVRRFSKVVCLGKSLCKLCESNNHKRAEGVTENKFLPFPVNKQFVAPIYVYETNEIMYIRSGQDFFDDISVYIDKFGTEVDFDVFKTGQNLDTRYKSIYLGPNNDKTLFSEPMKPKELNFDIGADELNKRLGVTPSNKNQQETKVESKSDIPKVETNVSVGNPIDGLMVINFGSHKGKTVKEIFDFGEIDYLKFLAKEANTVVKEYVSKFLEGKQ